MLKAGGKIPAAAMRCVSIDPITKVEGNSDAAKSLKVHLKARQRDPINHWFFGPIVHDFATAKLPEKVALDDGHGVEIGYARPSLTPYGLELSGTVFSDMGTKNEGGKRVAECLSNGIPQEASINFTGDYDLQEIPDKMTAEVNGKQMTGPMLVVKNWSLRSCAICKNGADPSTQTVTQFAGNDVAPLPLTITTMEPQKAETIMTDKPISAEAVAPVAPAVEAAKPTQLAEVPPVAVAVEAPKVEVKPEPTPLELAESKIKEMEQRIAVLSAGAPPVPVAGADKTVEQLMAEFKTINAADPIKGRSFWKQHEDKLQDPRHLAWLRGNRK